MDIPLKDFETRPDTQSVIKKARADKPYIKKLSYTDSLIKVRRYQCRGRSVKSTSGRRWLVVLYEDTDGQRYGTCTCPAGDPPTGEDGEPKWKPRVCFHIAAVYFHHKAIQKRLATRARRRAALAALAGKEQQLAATDSSASVA